MCPRDAAALVATLESAGVRLVAAGPQRVRLVTHLGLTDSDIGEALARREQALGGTPR